MTFDPIHLGEEQSRKVRDLARRAGISPEDIANRAVDQLYDHEVDRLSPQQAQRLSREAWRQRFERHLTSLPRTRAGNVDVSRESIY